jgi:LSD1 subclass zinc finger protein
MSIPFKCSSCGGPLQYDGGDITVRCEFCSNTVIVPEELRQSFGRPPSAVPFMDQMRNLKQMGQLIREGNKIQAIKLYRETFGVGLAEAKDAVEKLSSGHPVEVARAYEVAGQHYQAAQQPYGTYPQPTGSTIKGCSPVAIIIAIVILVALVLGGAAFAVFMGLRPPPRPNARPTVTSTDKPGTTRPGSGADYSTGFARPVLTFGTEGIGPGQFKDVRTVAVDGEGHIYAADYTGGRVQVFDADGKFLTQWMVDPKMPLLKLAADRKGTVYIVQSGDINRYEGMTGTPLGKVAVGGRGFDDVITTADGGLVAVQDSEDLVRFNAAGQVVSIIKDSVSGQSGDSELDAKVAADGLGNLYSMGRFNDAVFKYSPSGKFLTRMGGEGDERGLFRALGAIAVDGQGRVYVTDIKGIQVFDSNGRYIDVFKPEKGGAFGLVFNDNNELFVAARTQIVKYTLNK